MLISFKIILWFFGVVPKIKLVGFGSESFPLLPICFKEKPSPFLRWDSVVFCSSVAKTASVAISYEVDLF